MVEISVILAEIFVIPETDTIIPPFSSKIGKSLLSNPKNVSISPLKFNGKYLIKYSNVPTFLEVYANKVYSFEVGGNKEEVLMALSNLENKRLFNTLWVVHNVKIDEIRVNRVKEFEMEVLTPALLVNPFFKTKRKIFTNKASYIFFTNLLDVTGFKRGDEMLHKAISLLDSSLWEEPSIMKYAKVIYAGNEIIGMVGKLRYSVVNEEDIVFKVIENAIAKGIGSSRRNGFGRVRIRINGDG
ncbi:CRISPR-associated endoribonuclease Cas6 [Sulfolobus tengchongensis]|uniref:CRISPR-associated endoribonuclease Cas6 n=1 Tax=Sulfolobus tengchongensis TaxID=207809 RepID=A0AAX4L1S4_9CREN